MKELEQLKKEFQSEIPQKTESLSNEIEAILQALTHSTPGQVDWTKLSFIVHKLCGSTGTYGFLSLFTATSFLESLLTQNTFSSMSSENVGKYLRLWLTIFQRYVKKSTKEPPSLENEKKAAIDIEKELESLNQMLSSFTKGRRVA